jgi:luciferase-type oxidoreductase
MAVCTAQKLEKLACTMRHQTHTGFARVFQPGALTFGFIAPLESYPERPAPTMHDHLALARKADDAGFSAIWLRDVPFYDPSFGDLGQVFDPVAYAGFLAAATKRITIGTAGIVLPLRDPITVAKQATTLDHLTGNRFILGLSSGDRSPEYPAFGIEYESRADRFRDAHALIRALTEQSFPRHQSTHFGNLDGRLDLVPKPMTDRLPILAVGRAGQSIAWLAENMDGWIWHQGDFDRLRDVVTTWRDAIRDDVFKPYGYGTFFDLDRDPNAPLRPAHGLSIGRKALIELWKKQRDLGVSHVALNLKMAQRPAAELIDELGEHVLPLFNAH